MITGISPLDCVLFTGRNGRSANSPGSKMGRAFRLSSAARRVSPCRLVCLGRCALARQERVELAVELGQMLHGKPRDKLAARHDHLHLAQRLQVLERVLVEHNEVGCFPHLDRPRSPRQALRCAHCRASLCGARVCEEPRRCARSTRLRATCHSA